MSIPDFDRADYGEPHAIEGEVVGRPARRIDATFPVALGYGLVAAVVGSIGYAMVASLGFMISIVAIGIAWLIVKAMMTASNGIGGRPYQIAGVVLTYLAVSLGELLPELYKAHHLEGIPISAMVNIFLLKYVLLGPFLELQDGLNGILGIIILGIGLRAAWRWAAGSPGFSGSGRRRRVDPFGLR